MQKVAAYLIERRDAMNWPEARASEASQLKQQVEEWLRSKGAMELGPSGIYRAEDGSRATYSIEEAANEGSTWWMTRLEEVTEDGRRFLAAVSITTGSDKVAVYATLEVGSDATLVNPVEADPRCPKVIRTLLGSGRWYHGFTELRPLRWLKGFEEGQGIAAEVKHPERTVPIIAVTKMGQDLALPELAQCLTYDLSGLANVVVLDSDATWALTDYLGHALTCHSGAVRLYWPKLSISEDPYRHPLWTENRLRSAAVDLIATRERFRRQLRALVMGASALSVVRPREIDAIRSAASRRAFAELKARATSQEDLTELLDLYEKENDKLRETNVDLTTQVNELQVLLAKLESERAALQAHLRAKLGAAQEPSAGEDIEPDSTITDDQDFPEPASNDVRFYKKKFSTQDHDVMVRVNDCGHNRWQGAHSADKARKGVARMENGRTDWQTMQRCGSCKGGGMWRVRW